MTINLYTPPTLSINTDQRPVKWLALTIVFVTLFSGCANLPPPTGEIHNENISDLQHWLIEGKLGIRTENEAHSAYIHWNNSGLNYKIEIFGPFGKGKIHIEKHGKRVTLRDRDGELSSNSARELFYRVSGYDIPIESLIYWIKGQPSPDSNVSIEQINEQGQLTDFEQDTWRVSYRSFTEIHGFNLPNKITISQPSMRAKIIIKRWRLNPQ